MGTPRTTTRLGIPYPAENDDDWWDIENAVDGRMDKLDKLLMASLEDLTIHRDYGAGSGQWEYDRADSFDVTMGDVVIKSPQGGSITFTDGTSVLVAEGEYVWATIPERPLVSAHSPGQIASGPVYTHSPNTLLIGVLLLGKFLWLQPWLRN